MPEPRSTPQRQPDTRRRPRQKAAGFAILAAVYLAVVYLIPRPAAVKPEGWRLTGIFIAVIVGSALQPIPGGALVLIAITLSSIWGGLSISQALAGYADATVWLVMAAFFISRALINTGLARRIALFFVRLFGQSSLRVCYALALSDAILATVIPSNGARSGGVILPIARSIAELYQSYPGPTAGLIGSFLMTAVYQGICISAAMFFTGQASNPLAAQMAAPFGVHVTWASWFFAGIAPGLCSLIVVPWIVLRLNRPQIEQTPEAAAFARREMQAMGPMKSSEKILSVVFASVCALWVTSGWHGIDITVIALGGSVALLVMGVLDWEDVKGEKAAWEIFIWYGGLLRLGRALHEAGVTTAFANLVASTFSGAGWAALFVIALLIYFYAHYAFASITAHMLAMYPAFLAALLSQGAPGGLVVYAFACFTNLAAGLTNYGTTPSPMYFAQGYVSMKTWWRVGLVASVVNIAIWSTVGFAWWKALKIW
ncbi:MAG TPA: DASS family sodium-coupled anion symporter [Bryobacteraceae bacterium]|nr:DASS family sodium-coupled anion symporter [Bryobacteraceae bacterium]